ncbi:MAG: FlgD immunoglobulin-like domain containing protein [candidate division WOR-3 bacterium]
MCLVLMLILAAEEPTTMIVPPFRHTLGFNRIGRFYISMYLGPDFKLAEPEGLCGVKMEEEDDPSTGRDDHILTLFGVNSGTGQIVYNVRLLEPRIYGRMGSDTGQFLNPHGICCTNQGDVYVADTDNDRIVRLRYSNGRLSWVTSFGNSLRRPHDVAVDSRGLVYVADTENDRIRVFRPSGTLVADWSPLLEKPTGIGVLDQAARFNDFGHECAVVIDRGGTRLNQFNLSGQLLRQTDCRRIGLDTAGFAYCAFDRHGNLYVTDRLNSQVHLFDAGLRYIISYAGPADARLNSPRGIAIGRQFGQVFLSEADGGSYYWLGLDGYLIGCYPQSFNSQRPGTTIALYITEMAEVTVEVSDSLGRVVRSLTPPHQQRPGEVLIVWDGNDNQGGLVPEGEYRIKVTVRPVYSQPKYILKKELFGRVWRTAG